METTTKKTTPKAVKKPAAAKPAPAPKKDLVDAFLDEIRERNSSILSKKESIPTPPVINSIIGLKIIDLLTEIRDNVKK